MNQVRRNVLRGAVSTAVLSVAVAAGVLRAHSVVAAEINVNLANTLRALQASNPSYNNAIQIKAPDIAVDGASVFIDCYCALPDVDAMIFFVDRNPQPLIAAFQLAPEVVPALQLRIKVAQTAQVWAVVRSAGLFYKAGKTVKVTRGGCGVGLN